MFRTVSIIALSWHEVFITSTPREGTYELLAKGNWQLILSLMGMVMAVNEMRKIHYIPLNWKRCNKRNEKCFHFINIIHSPNNSEASEFLVPPHPAKATANRNTAMSCQFQRPEVSSYNIAWTEGWKFPRYMDSIFWKLKQHFCDVVVLPNHFPKIKFPQIFCSREV